MDEYISRKDVLRKFIEGDGHDDDRFTEGYNFAVQEYREKVKKIPAADVQPPVDQWIKEAKRLLKAAIEDIYQDKCDTCTQEIDCKFCYCEGLYKWRYVDEALELIGGDAQ